MKNIKYDNQNIFAKILRKEANANIVFENKYILCFKDILPKAPVHVLIIPKGQFKDIYDFSINASSEEKKAIYDGIARVIKIFDLETDGCRVITNFGQNGRQEVPHLHFHLLGGRDIGSMLS